ncbi:MAG: hypothetical protein ACR2IJ_07445 [Fluviibacter sp.]
MAKVNYYQFAIFGIAGVDKIEVIAASLPEAVKIAEEWELDGKRPIKVELMNYQLGKYELLGTE